jgi:hypothetical protein
MLKKYDLLEIIFSNTNITKQCQSVIISKGNYIDNSILNLCTYLYTIYFEYLFKK